MWRSTMKKFRRIVALTLAVMLMCSVLCIGASAASYKDKSRTFSIRLSDDYSEKTTNGTTKTYNQYDSIGTVTVKSTSEDGKKGTITFKKFTTPSREFKFKKGISTYYYTQNVVYKYEISKMKDGGKITLTLDSCPQEAFVRSKMTGRIHISGSKNFNNIWKIDGLGYGIYFRCKS